MLISPMGRKALVPFAVSAFLVLASTAVAGPAPGSGCVPGDPCDPLPVGPSVPGTVYVQPGAASAAESAATDGGVYSPTDPDDGGPGGAGALVNVELVGLPVAQRAAIEQSPDAVKLLAMAHADGARFHTVMAPIGQPNAAPNQASTGGAVCGVDGAVFTIPHTKKTAGALWFDFCTVPAVFADSYYWSDPRNLIFDAGFGGGADPKGSAVSVDYAITRSGWRGHRSFTLCWSARTSTAATGVNCVPSLGLPA